MSEKYSKQPMPRFALSLDGLDSMSPRSEIEARIRLMVETEKRDGLHPLDEAELDQLRKIRKVATETGGYQGLK